MIGCFDRRRPSEGRASPSSSAVTSPRTHRHYSSISMARLLKKCKKPDKKEFLKVARLTAVGFLAVGCLGFFVKLIFIPINQIIVSSQS